MSICVYIRLSDENTLKRLNANLPHGIAVLVSITSDVPYNNITEHVRA